MGRWVGMQQGADRKACVLARARTCARVCAGVKAGGGMDERADGQTDGRTDGRMDGRTDGRNFAHWVDFAWAATRSTKARVQTTGP